MDFIIVQLRYALFEGGLWTLLNALLVMFNILALTEAAGLIKLDNTTSIISSVTRIFLSTSNTHRSFQGLVFQFAGFEKLFVRQAQIMIIVFSNQMNHIFALECIISEYSLHPTVTPVFLFVFIWFFLFGTCIDHHISKIYLLDVCWFFQIFLFKILDLLWFLLKVNQEHKNMRG